MACRMLTLLAALLACSWCCLALDCDRGTSDGCSIPFDLPYFFKNDFLQECHKHDQCYACGVGHKISRADCDARFNTNLKRKCQAIAANEPTKLKYCEAVRVSYYLAVRAGGGLAYEKTPKSWCNQYWVSNCL